MADKVWTAAELISEGALNTVEFLYGRGEGFTETLNALRERFGERGQVRPSVAKELRERVLEAHNEATRLNSGDDIDPDEMPLRNDLVSNYRYVAVISISCPDGTEDSYPILVDSDELLTADEVLQLATKITNDLIGSKYPRLQKFDVNRRLGEPCEESIDIVEVWRRGE